MRLSRCGSLTQLPLTGYWFRGLRLMHWRTRLSCDHTARKESRYRSDLPNFPVYRVLYLGENHQVVAFEVGALLGDPSAPTPNPNAS